MAQLTHSVKRKKKQKTQNNDLGPAPNDIYNLTDEIQRIKQEEEKTEVTEPKPPESIHVVYDDMKEAKAALAKGETIRYMLPKHVSAEQIVKRAKSLGLNTTKLVKVLGSSMVIKKLIDSYVKKISANTEYDSYLKHCTEVKALRCNKDSLMPRFQVKMDLDYDTYYNKDDQFKTKFVKEVCDRVFQCSPAKLQIVSVKEGSLIAVAILSLITLAYVGVISINVYLYLNKGKVRNINHDMNDDLCGGEEQEFHLGQKVFVQKRNMEATVVSPLALDKNDNRVVRLRYDNGSDKKEEEFSLRDESLIAIEPGQDPDIEGSVHINENGTYIEAKKRKRWWC